jgi:putative ABC transport system permease protein
MFLNYLTTFLRILTRQKIYSAINVFGLAIGLAASLLIGVYLFDELSFDKFHQDANRIYRLDTEWVVNGSVTKTGRGDGPLADVLKKEIHDIESTLKIVKLSKTTVELDARIINVDKPVNVDSNFFSFFSFHWLEGDLTTALKGPNKIVLTRSLAQKVFGENVDFRDVVGKILVSGAEGKTMMVSGVCEDPPQNSHLHFDALFSMGEPDTAALSLYCYTYLKLRDNKDVGSTLPLIGKSIDRYYDACFQKYWSVTRKEFFQRGDAHNIFFRPLTDIHLYSDTSDEFEANGNSSYLIILALIAGFILLLAAINFMNLTTARAANRAKEVGIRKTIGAVQGKLIVQFMAESFIYVILALGIAMAIVSAAIGPFNFLSGKNFTIGSFFVSEILIGTLLLTVLIAVLSGSYPAFVLSSFRPAYVLKGGFKVSSQGGGFRNILVVFQFVISSSLIIASILVYQQLQHLQSQNPGFDRENVVCFTNASSLNTNWDAFRNEVKSNSAFTEIGRSEKIPSEIIEEEGIHRNQMGSDKIFVVNAFFADGGYLNVFNLELTAGRFFSRDIASDSTTVIINEAAARLLNVNERLTRKEFVSARGRTLEIVGIVKDYNFESLKSSINPLLIYNGETGSSFARAEGGNSGMVIRLSAGDAHHTLKTLESIWKKYTGAPFDYSFLDERLQSQYEAEEKLSDISIVFTVISVIIACFGLLGLVTYMATQRTKEIGIRKVLGASVQQVVVLLSRDFVRLILIAFVIAIPVSWYSMNQWLNTFAYRIDFSIVVALAAVGIVLVIALLTVSYQSIKAAIGNPVNSLRSE